MVVRHIKRLKHTHRTKLFEDLKNINTMSITTDFWTNPSSRYFIVITGHYYSTDFQLNSKVLFFSTFDERHTASQISRTITFKLRQLNLLHKVNRVVCDGARNIVSAIGTSHLTIENSAHVLEIQIRLEVL